MKKKKSISVKGSVAPAGDHGQNRGSQSETRLSVPPFPLSRVAGEGTDSWTGPAGRGGVRASSFMSLWGRSIYHLLPPLEQNWGPARSRESSARSPLTLPPLPKPEEVLPEQARGWVGKKIAHMAHGSQA